MANEKPQFDFSKIIPWYVLKAHLQHLEKIAQKKWLKSNEHDDMLRAQGELNLLDRLMNLPETLAFGETGEKQDAKPHTSGEG